MPAIIALGMSKGGSGKTTIGLLLADAYARQGWKVRIIDVDPQASSVKWLERTNAAGERPNGISVVKADGEAGLANALKDVEAFDVVLIDTQGAINQLIAMAASRADLVLIPCRASKQDLVEAEALLKFLDDLLGHLRPVEARLVLNDVDGLDPKQAPFKETLAYLVEKKMPYFTTMIGRRSLYKTFADHGASLTTMTGSAEAIAKAVANIDRLAREIWTLLTGPDEEEAA